MRLISRLGRIGVLWTSAAAVSVCLATVAVAQGLPSPFVQVVAAEASSNDDLAAFYKTIGYATVWTGESDAMRRSALLNALARAGDHALPVRRYDPRKLTALLTTAQTEGDRARAEVAFSMAYLAYARDIHSGVLSPKQIDSTIVRDIERPDVSSLMTALMTENPAAVLRDLAPKSPQYAQLMRAKIDLDAKIASGGWGKPVQAKALVPGDRGEAVVALRDRLIAMGYLGRSATQTYDNAMLAAVQRFQLDHGLIADGSAYAGTIEALNVSPQERQRSVMVAMERMRWMGDAPLGDRHIWVNLPDFTAKIVDHGKITFETRAVIGKNVPDQRTPEFSDVMEHMVINPSWGVPRSIIVSEYLPLLQRNPNAVSHLQVIDGSGRVVSRGAVNFAAYSARTFPFGLRQPPSDGNALGKVKFMFPNPHNIYLHDTPSKSLFAQEVRAYSHGCIRLADPIDFAHAILAVQSDDPEGQFDAALKTRKETTVKLKETIPVHLVYFTAFPGSRGQMTYRRDIYGRDADLARALDEAGVVTPLVQG
ncbi:MAG: L,D-transpeptidase family protein [Rhodobacteraceae bacterium]|nr:L,D-transpeptidase family protein [Paracoccaceae bacterium]MCF8515819.1 L,D-transpeptidase family protein [Paracoccaceae bacterium]